MRADYFSYERPQIWRAGGVPYFIDSDGNVEMMFMIPSTTEYNNSQPDLKMPQIAKGRIEKLEPPLIAAIRECAEELGIREDNILRTINIDVVLGRTYMFAFQVANKENFDDFNCETESVHWMTYDQFMTDGRELHKSVVDTLYNKMIEHYFEDLSEMLPEFDEVK